MSYVLNQVTTADRYTPGNTLRCPQTIRLRIQVIDNAIYYQIGRGIEGSDYSEPEAFLLPILASLDVDCDVVQIRSANPGAPAKVTVQALTAADLPEVAA